MLELLCFVAGNFADADATSGALIELPDSSLARGLYLKIHHHRELSFTRILATSSPRECDEATPGSLAHDNRDEHSRCRRSSASLEAPWTQTKICKRHTSRHRKHSTACGPTSEDCTSREAQQAAEATIRRYQTCDTYQAHKVIRRTCHSLETIWRQEICFRRLPEESRTSTSTAYWITRPIWYSASCRRCAQEGGF